jgi:hypothetical protein
MPKAGRCNRLLLPHSDQALSIHCQVVVVTSHLNSHTPHMDCSRHPTVRTPFRSTRWRRTTRAPSSQQTPSWVLMTMRPTARRRFSP